MSTDPTTSAIADQIADRERLLSENAKLGTALTEALAANATLTAERDRLCARVLEPMTEDQVVAALHKGHTERRIAEGNHAWTSLVADRDRLRGLVEEACGLLDDAVQLRDDCTEWFARIAKIRQAARVE